MEWHERRRRIRARLLSHHGRALVWAAAVAGLMLATLVLAFGVATSPKTAAGPLNHGGTQIACPPHLQTLDATCWKTR